MASSGALGSAGRATAALTLAATIGQAGAIGRDLFVAAKVGLSGNLDALLIAAAVPIAIAGILTSGAQTALISALSERIDAKGYGPARGIAGAMLAYTLLAGLMLTAVIVMTAPTVVAAVGAGLDTGGRRLAAGYLSVLGPILTFTALSAILSGVQQAAGRFHLLGAAWMTGPLVSLTVTILLWEQSGLTGYALALTVGAATTMLALAMLSVTTGSFPRLTLAVDRPIWAPVLRHALPLTAGSALLQMNLLVERIVASFLAPGSVSALRYGDLVIRAPLYAAGPAWAAVAYPTLARTARADDDTLGPTAEAAVRYALAVFIPLAVGLAAFAPLVVDILYGRGAFDPAAARVTSVVVIALAPLLAVQVIQPVLVGAHNARRRGGLLGILAAANVATTATLSVILALALGVAGVALALSLTSILVMTALTVALSRLEPNFSGLRIASSLAVILAISGAIALPAAGAAWWLHTRLPWPGDLAAVLVLSAVCLAAYIAVAARAGVEEVGRVAGVTRLWLSRLSIGRG